MKVVSACACGLTKPVPEDMSPGTKRLPSEGDFWLCSRCGQVHRYRLVIESRGVAKLVALAVSMDEIGQLPKTDRDAILGHRARIIAEAAQHLPQERF